MVPFFWLRPHFAGAVPAVKAVRKSDAETLQTRYAHMKLIAAKGISEHAEGSAAWESECSKRARTPQAVGSAAGAG